MQILIEWHKIQFFFKKIQIFKKHFLCISELSIFKIAIFLSIFFKMVKKNILKLNKNSTTKYCKKKPRLNILISRGDIKGDTGLMGHTVY
jgi:hypothetical protein